MTAQKLALNTLREGMLKGHAEPFFCHSIRSMLAERNQIDNWSHLKVQNCEEKLYLQFRNIAPKFFRELPPGMLLIGSVLDDWLDWNLIKQIPSLADLWHETDRGGQQIGMNYDFRIELLKLIIEDVGYADPELNFD